MSKHIRLREGLKINLIGEADKVYANTKHVEKYIIKPTDFHGLSPKLIVKKGDKVKAGTILFYDKSKTRIKFCSPVSGIVSDIVRGDKRRILEIVIQSDKDIIYEDFPVSNSVDLSREDIINKLLGAGLWPFIRQKPYDVIADPTDFPKSIFISTFKSAPLSVDNDFALYGMETLFQKGIDYIIKLTKGKIYVIS